jgi:hypothetical protein
MDECGLSGGENRLPQPDRPTVNMRKAWMNGGLSGGENQLR